MRNSSLLLSLRLAMIIAFIIGPVLYASHQQKQMKNFRVVREGVLYRSGQMTVEGLRRAIHDYGIRTVVTLRDVSQARDPTLDQAEEAFCRWMGLPHIRILPRPWEASDGGPAPVQVGVDQFLEVMRNPANHPVLVHCFAGTHRTGAYCAIYRMEFEGWTNEQALEELRSLGYPHIDEEKDIFGYLSSYRPRRILKDQ